MANEAKWKEEKGEERENERRNEKERGSDS
jgi:hypothetical protein